MDHSKALDKIKKLLRLAASDNPHEAAAAMRQARALMEKYRLEESDIQLSEVFECVLAVVRNRRRLNGKPTWLVLSLKITDCP